MEIIRQIQDEISDEMRQMTLNTNERKPFHIEYKDKCEKIYRDETGVQGEDNFVLYKESSDRCLLKPNPWKKEKVDIKFHKSSEVAQKLLTREVHPTKAVHVNLVNEKGNFYEINLSRLPLLQSGISKVLEQSSMFGYDGEVILEPVCITNYGLSEDLGNEDCLDSQDLMTTRAHILCCALENMLTNLGIKTKVVRIQHRSTSLPKKTIADTENKLKQNVFTLAESNLKMTGDCGNEEKALSSSPRHLEREKLFMDLEGFCHSNGIPKGSQGYDRNINLVPVINEEGKPTKHTLYACVLHQETEDNPHFRKALVLHVVPADELYFAQQCALIAQAFSEKSKSPKQAFASIYVEPKNSSEHRLKFGDHVKARASELLSAYRVKYGAIVTGKMWELSITSVARSSLIFEILACPISKKVTFDRGIKSQDCDGESQSRDSTFVLYNYARLAMLWKHFEEEVERGSYPVLPNVADIDFSTLREQSEWELFLHYVLFYPALIQSVISSLYPGKGIKVDIAVNKICVFLLRLSHDLSSYYHQTKVLLEPRPHLFPVVHARLALMLAIKQVMTNAFEILGIEPPSQM